MYGIYANIWGILMGSMLPYIAAPWILWDRQQFYGNCGTHQWEYNITNQQWVEKNNNILWGYHPMIDTKMADIYIKDINYLWNLHMYPMSCHPYIFSRPRPKPSFAPARPARSARAPVPNVPSARAPENGPVHASTRRMAWPWSKMGKNGDLLVERCGKMWKDVESEIHWKWNVFSKVGRCWKSQLENGAIRLHRKIVSSSFLMVKPPRNRWFESQTMQHPFCCFKAFVGKTCCLVKITFWLVKTLFCLVKTTIRLVKTTSCLVKAHGNMAFFPAFQGWNVWTLCRNLRLWKAPATRPIFVGNVVTSLGSAWFGQGVIPKWPKSSGEILQFTHDILADKWLMVQNGLMMGD